MRQLERCQTTTILGIAIAGFLSGCAGEPWMPAEEGEIGSLTQALTASDCGDASGMQAGAPWSVAGGCPTRLGLSSQHGPEGDDLNWSVSLLDDIYSSPAVRADGTIVIGSDIGRLFAVNRDGSIEWSTNVGNKVRAAPTVAADGTIYVGAHTNRFHAFDALGNEKWYFDTLFDITSSAVVGPDETVYFGSQNGSFYAFEPDGGQKWEVYTFGGNYGGAAIGPDGTVYFGSDNTYFYAVDGQTGAELWATTVYNKIRTTPVVHDGVVYFGSDANRLHAVDAETGQILWEQDYFADVRSSPAVGADGTIYIGADDKKLHAVSPSGQTLWTYTTGGDIRSTPVVDAAGRIYFGSNDNYVYALNPDGSLHFKYWTWGDVEGSPAIGAGGELIVGSRDGRLYSIGSSAQSGQSGTYQDDDCDGVADSQETAHGLDPHDPSDAEDDPDGDGITSSDELALGGDPLKADTDGDGIPDDPDLFNDTDFDGDGVVFESDNCLIVTNPLQEDSDGDGSGDLCDELADGTGASPVPVAVTRSPFGHYGLTRRDYTSYARLRGVEAGHVATGTGFRIFANRFEDSRAIVEFWDSSTGARAYARDAAEASLLEGQGMSRVGILGYVAIAPLSVGESAVIRKFVKSTTDHAITADPDEAADLLAQGYGEVSALGYGIKDYGQRGVVNLAYRFRDAAGLVVHSAEPTAEDLNAFMAEGSQFGVFSQRTGWTRPLYRLRNSAGDEVLSTDPSEWSSLVGYSPEGVVGYVFPSSGPVGTMEPLTRLYRLTDSSGAHEHRASLSEANALASSGYSLEVIARVVSLPQEPAGGTCFGAPSVYDALVDRFSGFPTQDAEIGAATQLISACALERALSGSGTSDVEFEIEAYLNTLDPETRQQLLDTANRTLTLSPGERAQLLGSLANLDPGSCTEPVDEIMKQMASAIAPRVTRNGLSIATLRAAHCQGVTYEPGDLGAGTGSNAFVASDQDLSCVLTGGDVQCASPTGSSVFPRLHGVIAGARVPSGSPAETEETEHPDVGFPLRGTDVGLCTGGSCAESLGQMCIDGRCMQFPMVAEGHPVTFSASNVWDPVNAELIFDEVDPSTGEVVNGTRFTSSAGSVYDAPPPDGVSRSVRCDANPEREALNTDSEAGIEQLGTLGGLDAQAMAGKFYRVRAVNFNGTFHRWGESLNEATFNGETGHTIHVCVEGRCEEPPLTPSAACDESSPPSCASEGVVWTTAPRSLEECKSMDPFGNACEETPVSFEGRDEGIIYVEDPDNELFTQVRLSAIHCQNETGGTNRPNVNPDELMLGFEMVSMNQVRRTGTIDAKDLEDRGDVLRFSMNTGDRTFPNTVLGSVPVGTTRANGGENADLAGGLLVVGENDRVGAKQWLAAHAIGLVTFLAGGGSQYSLATGVGAEFGSLIAFTTTDTIDPDDPVGRGAFHATISEIQSRGINAHDGNTANAVPLMTRLPETAAHILDESAGSHPAVDARVFNENASIETCSSDSDCAGTSVCRFGACTPAEWEDPTEPLFFDPAHDIAGTIERWRFNGTHSDYRVYISTSVSDEHRRQSQ